jgi:hypothetical protein
VPRAHRRPHTACKRARCTSLTFSPPTLPPLHPPPPPQDYASLDPYAPVKPLDVLAEEIGVKVEDLVKLDANENLYGPLPEVREGVTYPRARAQRGGRRASAAMARAHTGTHCR